MYYCRHSKVQFDSFCSEIAFWLLHHVIIFRLRLDMVAGCVVYILHSLAQLVKVVAIIFPCLIGQLLENPSQLLSAKTAAI